MQKLCFILFGLIICGSALAANMCVKNDGILVALDPVVGGTSNGSNATAKTWSTKFSYGIISGIAACTGNYCTTQGCVPTNQNMSVYSTGDYCYCRMLRPASSRWVYSGSVFGRTPCVEGCAGACASRAASDVPLRRGLFGNVIE